VLIAGERRLRAALLLGWTHISASVVDIDAIVRGEFAENAHRKDFTLSETAAIKRALEPIERAAAKRRQGERRDKHPEKFSTSLNGRALDKGRSRRGGAPHHNAQIHAYGVVGALGRLLGLGLGGDCWTSTRSPPSLSTSLSASSRNSSPSSRGSSVSSTFTPISLNMASTSSIYSE
jgi:ParB/Sulfiredoxin domain